jgi:beta-mannosidase
MSTKKISLNSNDWLFVKDPNSTYSYDSIVEKFLSNKISGKIKVPSNWELENHNNFSGTIWHIKKFNLKIDVDKNLVSTLVFNGIDYFAEIWLNKNYLGFHEGYFQKFEFEVTDFLNSSTSNLLIVKVTSPKELPGKVWPHKKQLIKGIFNHHDCRPGGWSLEFGQDKNTGGIWNSVELVINQNIRIDKLKIEPKIIDEKLTKINLTFSYKNKFVNAISQKFLFEILSPDKKKLNIISTFLLQPSNGKQNLIIDIPNPKLWWSWDLGKSNIYNLKIKIDDEILVSENFGIKEISLSEKHEFILNGKKLFLRGTNIIPEQMLSLLDSTKIKQIVALLKEANVNIVRIHAHVNRQELYEELDKKGILIWQDFALQWTYDNSNKFTSNAIRQIKEMVNQYYNHPSIAFWCCHNEPGEQIKTLDQFLFNAVKEEDSSRIVRIASNYEEHPYDGWYWGNKEHFASTPMGPLVTEFGAQGIPNKNSLKKFIPNDKIFPMNLNFWEYHDFQPNTTFKIAKINKGKNIDEFVENSQNYQSDLLKTAIHFYRRKKNKDITGIFQFMFIDCWPSITWSVVDYYFEKKKAFITLNECFNPILLSVNLRQDVYSKNEKLNFDFHVINDLYKKITNATVEIFIDDKKIDSITKLNIDENSIIFKNYESMSVKITNGFKKGNYKLEFKLKIKNKVISVNQFPIKIITHM